MELFAKKLNVENNNAKPGSPKLKVFRKDNGVCLPMDSVMNALLSENHLVDGESLVLELYTPETVDTSSELLLKIDKYTK